MSKRSKENEKLQNIAKTVALLNLAETKKAIEKVRAKIGEMEYIYSDETEQSLYKDYKALEYKKEDLCYELERLKMAVETMSAEETIAAYPRVTARTNEINKELEELDRMFISVKFRADKYVEKELDKLAQRRDGLCALLEELRTHERALFVKERTLVAGLADHSTFESQMARQISSIGFIQCSSVWR